MPTWSSPTPSIFVAPRLSAPVESSPRECYSKKGRVAVFRPIVRSFAGGLNGILDAFCFRPETQRCYRLAEGFHPMPASRRRKKRPELQITFVIWDRSSVCYCVSKPDVKSSERGFPLQTLHLLGGSRGSFTPVKRSLQTESNYPANFTQARQSSGGCFPKSCRDCQTPLPITTKNSQEAGWQAQHGPPCWRHSRPEL